MIRAYLGSPSWGEVSGTAVRRHHRCFGRRARRGVSLRLPTMAATGGMTMATTLIAIAAPVEKSRTTNQAEMMSRRQVPISTKYRCRRSIPRS